MEERNAKQIEKIENKLRGRPQREAPRNFVSIFFQYLCICFPNVSSIFLFFFIIFPIFSYIFLLLLLTLYFGQWKDNQAIRESSNYKAPDSRLQGGGNNMIL